MISYSKGSRRYLPRGTPPFRSARWWWRPSCAVKRSRTPDEKKFHETVTGFDMTFDFALRVTFIVGNFIFRAGSFLLQIRFRRLHGLLFFNSG